MCKFLYLVRTKEEVAVNVEGPDMGKSHNVQLKKDKVHTRKPIVLLVAFIFIAACAAAIYSYVHQLENAFLTNTMFYMSEIADHDMKSVDQEIEKQWDRLETVGKKFALERYDSAVDIQYFLNLETKATGFKDLMLIDENGMSYGGNYVVEDINKQDWGSQFMEDRTRFVTRSKEREEFVVLYSNLMYGVPIDPVTVDGVTYIGLVGKYSIDSVKDSMKLEFFNNEGQAKVIGRDGVVITTDITQRGIELENVLDELKKSTIIRNDDYDSIEKKISAGKKFDTVYKLDGETYIMSAKPLENGEWMVVVTVPYSVSSSQTMSFLKMTAFLLTILCVVIAIVLIFAFISYKRTMILKNSKEIFYRERLFNLLTNHTDDVFVIQDIEKGVLNFISENAVRTLGIAPKIGTKSDLSFLDDDSRELLLEKVQEIKDKRNLPGEEEHEHVEMEFAWTMPESGEKKWMHMVIYNVVTDITGKSESCLIIVISDYTQVKENQRKLEAAMMQAQDAARSKTLFLSNMSHEMRTPLNGIVGCIGMLKAHPDDKEQYHEYLGKAESTAKYLISLVSDILDMSKIESHKMMLEEREVSLREICTNMETMFRSQMKGKGLSFRIELDQPLWVIKGDEVRIQQILINLLGNAQKFTDEGGAVELHIWQEKEDGDNVRTRFTVSDTGIGMSQSFQERIWMPFEQERLDAARLHGGTGLGLAISYELAKMMNGTISVTSEIGRGSIFRVELVQRALYPDENGIRKIEPVQEEKEPLIGRKILVAEDNELNREILIAMLTEMGAEVLVAVNGSEALDLFEHSKEGEIDAVLMDMQMPVMDGCTAASRIRALKRPDAKKVTIVACTANAFQEDIDSVKQAGMDEHISKPLDMEKLVRILKELWEGKRNEK